jgi:hypothetical protein
MELGIKPIWIFDGKPPELKFDEVAENIDYPLAETTRSEKEISGG